MYVWEYFVQRIFFKCSCLQSSQRPPGGFEVLHFWATELGKLHETLQIRDFLIFCFLKAAFSWETAWPQYSSLLSHQVWERAEYPLTSQDQIQHPKNRRKSDSGLPVVSWCRSTGATFTLPLIQPQKVCWGPAFSNCTDLSYLYYMVTRSPGKATQG